MLRFALLTTAVHALPVHLKQGLSNETASALQPLQPEAANVSALDLNDLPGEPDYRSGLRFAYDSTARNNADLALRVSQLSSAGLPGYDFYSASDMKMTISSDPADEPDAVCAENCEEMSNCYAWVRAGTQCKLSRGTILGYTRQPGNIAGAPARRSGFMDNCDISGTNVGSFDATGADEFEKDRECTAACEASILCEFWTRTTGGVCVLKRKPMELSATVTSRCGAPDTRVCDGAKFYSEEGYEGVETEGRSMLALPLSMWSGHTIGGDTKSFKIPSGCLVSAVVYTGQVAWGKERSFIVGAPQISKQGAVWPMYGDYLRLNDLTYKRYTSKTQGLYMMPPVDTDLMDEAMISASVPYDYVGGKLTMDNQPDMGSTKWRALFVFGGSLLRMYADTMYRGTDTQPVGVTKKTGMQFPSWGTDPKSAVRWQHFDPAGSNGNGHAGECMTANDDKRVILSTCVNGFSNQMWYKDYHPGLEGRFLIKFMYFEKGGLSSTPMCMYALNEGNLEGKTGFYYALDGSDAKTDRRRLLGWGPCDASSLDHQWETKYHAGLQSNKEHIISAQQLQATSQVRQPGPVMGFGATTSTITEPQERLSLVFGCGDEPDFKSDGLCLENDRSGTMSNVGLSSMMWPQMSLYAYKSYKLIDRNSPEAVFVAGGWELAGSVHKIDADPTWPVVAYGSAVEQSSATEDGFTVGEASETTWGLEVFGELEYGAFSTSASVSTSRTSAIETETARTKAAENVAATTVDTTCPLTCTIPGYVDGPASKGAYIAATNGVGFGVGPGDVSGDGSLAGRDGCTTGLDDALLYVWRWKEDVQTEGGLQAKVGTCHAQCTCTPEPPKCKLGHCNGPFCEGPCLPASGAATKTVTALGHKHHAVAPSATKVTALQQPGAGAFSMSTASKTTPKVLDKQCQFGKNEFFGGSPSVVSYHADGCDAHCDSTKMSLILTGGTTITPSSMGTKRSVSGIMDGGKVPLGCAMRVYTGNGEEDFTDFLHDFTAMCSPDLQVQGVAFFGYDPTHDNRVLVMDHNSEKAGDLQNACRGQLLEPGPHKSVALPGANSYSLKVLGGAKATTFTTLNFLGTQRDLVRGAYMGFHETDFSMEVHGHSTTRSISLQAKWSLAATVDRDNSAPEWPTIEMGVAHDTEKSSEEEEELSTSVEWAVEAELTVGYGTEDPSPLELWSVSGGITGSHASSWESSQSTARAVSSAIASGRETNIECPLTCPIPGHNQAGKGGEGPMLYFEDGVGRDCPDAHKGNQVYIWRWDTKATLPSPGEAGEATIKVATCHTQCTCTPTPPKCDFTQCADRFCTYCKGEPTPTMTGSAAGQHYPKDQITGNYVANSAPGADRSYTPGV
jgi:hypothetical protein